MNDLLYFNNNTPNYEYILKDIIIDNNLSNLDDLFTKEEFDNIFIQTKNNLDDLFSNFKKNNFKIIYNNCDYKIRYQLYIDNLNEFINKFNSIFNKNYFNYKYIDCCPQNNKNILNYFSFNKIDKSFKKEFYLQSINLYFNKNDFSIYIIINNTNKNKKFIISKPICIKDQKIKKLHFNNLINYINNLSTTNIISHIFKIL